MPLRRSFVIAKELDVLRRCVRPSESNSSIFYLCTLSWAAKELLGLSYGLSTRNELGNILTPLKLGMKKGAMPCDTTPKNIQLYLF